MAVEMCTWMISHRLEDLSLQLSVWMGKIDKFIKKKKNTKNFLDSIAEKLNIGLAHVNDITEGLAYKKDVLDGCCISLCPKWRQQDWK